MEIPPAYKKTRKILRLLAQIEKKRELLENLSQKTKIIEESLLPRRKEILDVIRDHKVVSSDFIMRRFLMVSSRMIRYDLKQLEKSGFIVKIGVTRGAMYKAK